MRSARRRGREPFLLLLMTAAFAAADIVWRTPPPLSDTDGIATILALDGVPAGTTLFNASVLADGPGVTRFSLQAVLPPVVQLAVAADTGAVTVLSSPPHARTSPQVMITLSATRGSQTTSTHATLLFQRSYVLPTLSCPDASWRLYDTQSGLCFRRNNTSLSPAAAEAVCAARNASLPAPTSSVDVAAIRAAMMVERVSAVPLCAVATASADRGNGWNDTSGAAGCSRVSLDWLYTTAGARAWLPSEPVATSTPSRLYMRAAAGTDLSLNVLQAGLARFVATTLTQFFCVAPATMAIPAAATATNVAAASAPAWLDVPPTLAVQAVTGVSQTLATLSIVDADPMYVPAGQVSISVNASLLMATIPASSLRAWMPAPRTVRLDLAALSAAAAAVLSGRRSMLLGAVNLTAIDGMGLSSSSTVQLYLVDATWNATSRVASCSPGTTSLGSQADGISSCGFIQPCGSACNQTNAAAVCNAASGRLLSLRDLREWSQLRSLLGAAATSSGSTSAAAWIGLQLVAGTWVWHGSRTSTAWLQPSALPLRWRNATASGGGAANSQCVIAAVSSVDANDGMLLYRTSCSTPTFWPRTALLAACELNARVLPLGTPVASQVPQWTIDNMSLVLPPPAAASLSPVLVGRFLAADPDIADVRAGQITYTARVSSLAWFVNSSTGNVFVSGAPGDVLIDAVDGLGVPAPVPLSITISPSNDSSVGCPSPWQASFSRDGVGLMCVLVVPTEQTRAAADATCTGIGGTLATFLSVDEHAAVQRALAALSTDLLQPSLIAWTAAIQVPPLISGLQSSCCWGWTTGYDAAALSSGLLWATGSPTHAGLAPTTPACGAVLVAPPVLDAPAMVDVSCQSSAIPVCERPASSFARVVPAATATTAAAAVPTWLQPLRSACSSAGKAATPLGVLASNTGAAAFTITAPNSASATYSCAASAASAPFVRLSSTAGSLRPAARVQVNVWATITPWQTVTGRNATTRITCIMNIGNTTLTTASIDTQVAPELWPAVSDVVTELSPTQLKSAWSSTVVPVPNTEGGSVLWLGASTAAPYISAAALPAAGAPFSIIISGATNITLVAGTSALIPTGPVFSNETRVFVGNVSCVVSWVSADGRLLRFTTPSVRDVCSTTQMLRGSCGVIPLTIRNPGADATRETAPEVCGLQSTSRISFPANSTSTPRYITSDGTSVVGVSMSCPPMCPGAPGALNLTASLDVSTSASITAAVSAASATRAIGMLWVVACSGNFTNPATGACSNPQDPRSFACAYGAGSDCSRCPAGALCPGGYIMWARSGHWISRETSNEVIACKPPAQQRCTGWSTALGASRCGVGFKQDSPACLTCAVGYFPDPVDGCALCPDVTAVSLMTPFFKLGGALAGIVLGIIGIVILITKQFGGTVFGGLERSRRFIFATLLVMQTVSQAGQATTVALPPAIRAMFTLFDVFQFRSLSVHPACLTAGASLKIQTALLAVVTVLVLVFSFAHCGSRRNLMRALAELRAVAAAPWRLLVRMQHSPSTVRKRRYRSKFLSSLRNVNAQSRGEAMDSDLLGLSKRISPRQHAMFIIVTFLTMMYSIGSGFVFQVIHCVSGRVSVAKYLSMEQDGTALAAAGVGSSPDEISTALLDDSIVLRISILAADTNIVCYEGAHRTAAAFAWLALFFYVIGYPLLTAWLVPGRIRHVLRRRGLWDAFVAARAEERTDADRYLTRHTNRLDLCRRRLWLVLAPETVIRNERTLDATDLQALTTRLSTKLGSDVTGVLVKGHNPLRSAAQSFRQPASPMGGGRIDQESLPPESHTDAANHLRCTPPLWMASTMQWLVRVAMRAATAGLPATTRWTSGVGDDGPTFLQNEFGREHAQTTWQLVDEEPYVLGDSDISHFTGNDYRASSFFFRQLDMCVLATLAMVKAVTTGDDEAFPYVRATFLMLPMITFGVVITIRAPYTPDASFLLYVKLASLLTAVTAAMLQAGISASAPNATSTADMPANLTALGWIVFTSALILVLVMVVSFVVNLLRGAIIEQHELGRIMREARHRLKLQGTSNPLRKEARKLGGIMQDARDSLSISSRSNPLRMIRSVAAVASMRSKAIIEEGGSKQAAAVGGASTLLS